MLYTLIIVILVLMIALYEANQVSKLRSKQVKSLLADLCELDAAHLEARNAGIEYTNQRQNFDSEVQWGDLSKEENERMKIERNSFLSSCEAEISNSNDDLFQIRKRLGLSVQHDLSCFEGTDEE